MPCAACGDNCQRDGYDKPCSVPDGEYGFFLDDKLHRTKEPSLSVAVVRSQFLQSVSWGYSIYLDLPGCEMELLTDRMAIDCKAFPRLSVVPPCGGG